MFLEYSGTAFIPRGTVITQRDGSIDRLYYRVPSRYLHFRTNITGAPFLCRGELFLSEYYHWIPPLSKPITSINPIMENNRLLPGDDCFRYAVICRL